MFYNAEKVRKEVIAACLKMKQDGLIVRTYGNISGRISDDEFVITPSGKPYENLKPEDLVAVRIEDLSYEGDVIPSSEKGVHAAIYKNRPEVGFVIHTHQQYATLLSTLGEDLPAPTSILEEEELEEDGVAGEEAGTSEEQEMTSQNDSNQASDQSTENFQGEFVGTQGELELNPEEGNQSEWKFYGSSVPCAAYGLNGSDKLIQAIEDRVIDTPDASSILMKNHGVLCFGKNRAEAEEVVKSLEDMSRILYRRKCAEILKVAQEKALELATNEEGEVDEFKKFTTEPVSEKALPHYVTTYPLTKKTAILSSLPATVYASKLGKELPPYLDDVAMTVGPQIGYVTEGASGKEILAQLPDFNGAVLFEGYGAICVGVDVEEARIVAQLVEKNCLASFLEGASAVTKTNAKKEHKIYMDKYSKLARKK